MGKENKEIKKIVLDTNILISALLFKGELSKIVDLWEKGKITPVISKETFEEFRDVLKYPKFSLTKDEVKTIVEEKILPFFEVIDISVNVNGICKDPGDDKFLSCAVSASADFIVTGDKDFGSLKRYKSTVIIKPSDFLRMF